MKPSLILAIAPMLAFAAPAGAAVITALPGGTALDIPALNQFNGRTGPHVRDFEGGTFTSDGPVLWGWTSAYDFHAAGSPAAISFHTGEGRFAFDLDAPVGAALLNIDWGTQNRLWDPLTLSAYDGAGGLLQSVVLASGGVDHYTRGNIGLSFAGADIRRIELTGQYFSARDLMTGMGAAAVPEPATWAMLIVGFGAVGGVVRRGRRMAGLNQVPSAAL